MALMVPFEVRNGKKTILSYDDGRCETEGNSDFEMILVFSHFSRGRSSVTAVFLNPEETFEASMFVSDLSDAIIAGANLMHCHGIFTYIKKGSNIGIKLKELL